MIHFSNRYSFFLVSAFVLSTCIVTNATAMSLTGKELGISLGFEVLSPFTDSFVVGPGIESDQWEQVEVLVTNPPQFEIDTDGSRINIKVLGADGFAPASGWTFRFSDLSNSAASLGDRISRSVCEGERRV